MDSNASNHGNRGRVEDARLVTGRGRYAADWNDPGQLYGYFVRADRSHARILAVNVERARAHPGVTHVFTGEDAMAAGYTRMTSTLSAFTGRDGVKPRVPLRPALAHGKVRFVGEAVALVVAGSAAAAQDAAELVDIEYEELPCVVRSEDALASGAPLLHDDIAGNQAMVFEAGNAAAVESAFAAAAHITRLKVESTRVAPSPLEPRACRVAFDAASGEYLFNVCTQGITTLRDHLATYTGVPADKLKFEVRDIGGGFGQRTPAYPEYCALMLAARASGKPVKWVSTRVEGFLCDTHGRSNIIDGELALDGEGHFLGMRMRWITDVGAYLAPGPMGHLRNTSTCLGGVYRIPALHAEYRVTLTNATPVASYRGAGRPDIAYAVERLVERAAAEMGIDPVELRRRNFIAAGAFPYKTPTASTYENGDFAGLLDKALKLADWQGYAGRQAKSAAAGKLRGIGLSTVIENTGTGPREQLELALSPGGRLTVYTVSKSQGQGHETTLTNVVSRALGIPMEQIAIEQCPVGIRLTGGHTGGSHSAAGAGSLSFLASNKLIDEGRQRAALEMGVKPEDVEYANGSFRSRSTAKAVSLADLGRGEELRFMAEADCLTTFPNGCHIAEVEIDPDTGAAKVMSYCAVEDCGNIINHTIVEGQLHGAVMQGAGQVFGEHVIYDRDTGQMLTASFMDYPMPRAGLIPTPRVEHHYTASKANALGAKGVGESGCTASIPALTNAVMEALRPLGIAHLDMPLTPMKLWRAIRAAGN